MAIRSLAISPVIQTLSNAHSISRNNAVVALLLVKPCDISVILNNTYVVECPLLKSYWSFLITFSCRS